MEDNADVVMVAKLECTAWAIWHNRNATRYGGKQRTGKEVVSCRNGNGSGSGRVFSYPDPTRGPRPVARTRPVY